MSGQDSVGIGTRSLFRGFAIPEQFVEAGYRRVRRLLIAALRGVVGVLPRTAPAHTAPLHRAPLHGAPVHSAPVHDAPTATPQTSAAIIRSLSSDRPDQPVIQLIQRVFLAPGSERRRTVLFTGIEHDNGCASICMRAGRTLAQLRTESVCLVDAHLGLPPLRRDLGTGNGGRLTTAIGQPPSAMRPGQRLSPDNLWLLSSGSSSATPGMLPTYDGVGPQIRELGDTFDRILITAPPINLYPESLALSQLVDGVVLVLQANATRRATVRSTKELLDTLNVPLLGVVLNDRTFPIPETLYRML